MKEFVKAAKMVGLFGSYILCCFGAGVSLGALINTSEED